MKIKFDTEIISKLKLLCKDQYGELYYHAGILYWKECGTEKPQRICSICQRKYVKIRFVERLLRLEPRFAVPAEEIYTYYVSYGGALNLVNVRTKSIYKAVSYRKGMNNPLHITKLEGIHGFEDGYVFGDYWGNLEKECVNIYRLYRNECTVKYRFAPSEIQHIHSINVDQQSKRVLICTGDTDEESGIWEAFDDFKYVKPLIRGSQNYRTCGAYITDRGILYATDTPLCENAIYLFDEKQQKLNMVYKMPGPCVYSTKIKNSGGADIFVFATSVEPDSSLPAWRYYLTGKLGAGVTSRQTHIIIGNVEEGFREIAAFRKDAWPMWLFQFGNVHFPEVYDQRDHIICTGQSLEKYDGKTFCISI